MGTPHGVCGRYWERVSGVEERSLGPAELAATPRFTWLWDVAGGGTM